LATDIQQDLEKINDNFKSPTYEAPAFATLVKNLPSMLTSAKVISRWATDVYETSTVLVEKVRITYSHWTFYMSQHRHDALQSRRGAVSIVAASILATAGYTAMLVGALLCVLAA
ncbi:unnamed protein product, partial [Strongylus vulgaris]